MSNKQSLPITLRPWAEDDLELLQGLMGDPAMMLHLGGPESSIQICERHERYLRYTDSDSAQMLVIVTDPDRTPVGSIGYWAKQWNGQSIWETGWSILPAFQGYGIATHAITLLVQRIRAKQTIQFLHAFPSIANSASNAICRKTGFSLRGEMDFEYPPGSMMRCNNWQLDVWNAQAIEQSIEKRIAF